MSTVEHIDAILKIPYGQLSKKEIEYCLNVIKMKRHEVIFNTTTRLYIKMAKHALSRQLWNICSKCCKYITFMINNYKVDKSMECELYILLGYLISKTPYMLKEKIKNNKVKGINIIKLKDDADALRYAIKGFIMAVDYNIKELIIDSTVFIWHIMEFWLNVSREFSYLYYSIIKTFDETITKMDYENKKWVMFIKYELTKCLIDIRSYNYNLQKIKLKNIGQENMDVEFDTKDTTIFPDSSYLKNILLNLEVDKRLMLYLLIQKTLNALPKSDLTDLIMKQFKEVATLSKMHNPESYPDFLELYILFILNNFKKQETKNYISSIIKEFNINENEKIFISLLKCDKKLPLTLEKIDKLYNKITKYYTFVMENEEEGHYITFDNYKWSPQNYYLHLTNLALQSKYYAKARSILRNIKFEGYTDKSLILKKKLLEHYVDMDEFLANPTLVLLSSASIDFQLNKIKKMKELIVTYEKQDGDKNFIQKTIQDIWNYMFPLLQQRLYPRIKPYIEFLHKTLDRIDSPLFILRSVIGKELSKICDNDLEYTRALKYLKNAYLIVNDYNGLLKSNTYHLLNLKCNPFQNDVMVEEKLYLKVEEFRKGNNYIPDDELENILKIYLYDFTNVKRNMEVEEIILQKYNTENYKMRYIKEFQNNNRCKTAMMALNQIIDLAFQRKIYSIAFDGASIIIFNEWDKEFKKEDYFKISVAHVSHIRAFIILHYWKLFKNSKQQQEQKIISYGEDKRFSNLFSMNDNKSMKNKITAENEDITQLTTDATSNTNIDVKYDNDPSKKYVNYYESRNDSLPYKEKIMADVLRAINIGLELNKQWIVNNSASIIYDFILIQSKTIINENKDCLFMGYFDEIKILYEKLKLSKATSSLLYIYICAIYMQANIETIEYEIYGEIKVTNEQRKLLENKNNGMRRQELNSNFAVVKEIYNFFTNSNLKLDNYTSMTISNLWIRYKQAKTDEESTIKDIDKNSLYPIDALENIKVTSIAGYQKIINGIIDNYLSMEKSITLSNWLESLVRIGRCALKQKLYISAYKCFDKALKIKISTNINAPEYKNKYDANICFYWTSIGYFEYANVYQEFININYVISNIQTMHLDSINFLIESTKYLRLQSNVSYELFVEIAKRVWNIALKLLKYKTSYQQLEKELYELVFVTNRIITEIKKFKEYFRDPDNEVVQIFTHIFSLLLELNLLNKNWTSGLHIISKLNALLPKKVDNYCNLEKLQFFYHTNNEMGLNALFFNKPDLQLFYWTNIACIEDADNDQAIKAFETCLKLCDDSNKKSEYLIKYVDWMYSHYYTKEQYMENLNKAWDLIDSSINHRINSLSSEVPNPAYIDENKHYSVYQTELLIRSFLLYLNVNRSKSNTINCILSIYTLLKNLIENTYQTAINLQSQYKFKKNSNISGDNNLENEENIEENNVNGKKDKKKGINKKESKIETSASIVIPELPDNNKNWVKYIWPEAMFNILEDSSNEMILSKRNIKSSLSLIGTLCYIIEECMSLLRYNYVYFFLWVIDLITDNFLESKNKSIIKCYNSAIGFHFYNKLNERDIALEKLDNLLKQFSEINIDLDVFSDNKLYSIDKLDIYQDFPYDNNSIIIKIIEIFILNKKLINLHKIKSFIKQIEDSSIIKNNYIMSKLIYCKLNIKDNQNINYGENTEKAEKEYIDLCKIGLNLKTNIKMKYQIALCYLNYFKNRSSTLDELEKASHFTLNILINSSGNENKWYSKVIIGKFYQYIGELLGNFVFKSKDYNKIFILAYEHFNHALSIFNSNELHYHKSLLIIDYVKVIYSHLLINKVWSKNLLLLCLSLLKEGEIALEQIKDNINYIAITETNEYKTCVDLISMLEVELYIIMNKLEISNLYDSQMTIKNMVNNYIYDTFIPSNINEIYDLIKQVSLDEALNTCLNLKENLSANNSNICHMLFLYGIVQCLISSNTEETAIIDLNHPVFNKTLKLNDDHNIDKYREFIKIYNSNDSNSTISKIEEDFFSNFHNNINFKIFDKFIEKIKEDQTINIESSNEVNTTKSNTDETKKSKKLNKLESTMNVLPTKDSSVAISQQAIAENGKVTTPENDILSVRECFRNAIVVGLSSLDYQHVELCSEYLYKLTNDDYSQKFGYLSLLQNCIYSNIYKQLLMKTTKPEYSYSYIESLLKEQVNNCKEFYIQNNITTGWRRYLINKNYLNNFKNIPKGIDILIIQHSLNKKMLYTGLINKENNPGKGNNGSFQYDFLEYEVNYEEWNTLINNYNSIIEEYEIDSDMLDYIITKEFNDREAAANKATLENEDSMKFLNGGESKNDINDSGNENETTIKKDKKEKKKKNNIKVKNEEKDNEEISSSEINQENNSTEEQQLQMKKNIENEIGERIPENILIAFQGYISKIVDYLSPIFDHYKKVKNVMNDKKKNPSKSNEHDKTKQKVIICCDETFLLLPLGFIFNRFSSWDIIYKEFSYNMLLHRYKEQFGSDKEFPPQGQDFMEVNYLNCMVNFDKDAYAKKDKYKLKDIQINNLNELKNILFSNNVLNKWPGSYFTKIQSVELEHFFSPPGFLYMSYKRLFDDIQLNKFNYNLTGVNHAILLENVHISKFKTNVYKLNIKEIINTVLLFSLYGVNSIYYQPYIVNFDTNKIILDTIFKCHGVPLNEVLIKLSDESKIPISCYECFGLPTSLRIKTEKKEGNTK